MRAFLSFSLSLCISGGFSLFYFSLSPSLFLHLYPSISISLLSLLPLYFPLPSSLSRLRHSYSVHSSSFLFSLFFLSLFLFLSFFLPLHLFSSRDLLLSSFLVLFLSSASLCLFCPPFSRPTPLSSQPSVFSLSLSLFSTSLSLSVLFNSLHLDYSSLCLSIDLS